MADSPDSHLFQVVESGEFLVRVEQAIGSVQRWDEVKRGLGWMLEIAPNLGQYMPAYDMWALKLQTDPTLVIYYDIDEHNRIVRLVDVMVLEG